MLVVIDDIAVFVDMLFIICLGGYPKCMQIVLASFAGARFGTCGGLWEHAGRLECLEGTKGNGAVQVQV